MAFTDEEPDPIEEQPEETTTWEAADEGDRRYDAWYELQMEAEERRLFPENRDVFLSRLAAKQAERQERENRREAA